MPSPPLPPRPNPGPEPWPSPEGFDPRWLAAASPAVAGLAWWIARRRRVAAVAAPEEPTPGPDATPGLVGLAERLREALADRYGASWIAKTTEEIAGAIALADDLAPEARATVIHVLRAADLAKFAARDAEMTQGDEGFAARVEAALAALGAEGARSIRNGR